MTSSGGSANDGIVFKVTAAKVFTLLHTFTGTADGQQPYGSLTQGVDGNLYGTATYGGASGDGVVFKVTPAGSFTLLHNFTGGASGATPTDALVQGADGDLYGTTLVGGSGYGTVFSLSPSGIFTLLHSFTDSTTDGGYPYGGLVQGADGNFYGLSSRRQCKLRSSVPHHHRRYLHPAPLLHRSGRWSELLRRSRAWLGR